MHVVYGLALIVLGGHLDTKMFRSWGPFLNVFIFHLLTLHYLLRLSKRAITILFRTSGPYRNGRCLLWRTTKKWLSFKKLGATRLKILVSDHEADQMLAEIII